MSERSERHKKWLRARIAECDAAIRGALTGGMRINRRDMEKRKRSLERELQALEAQP